ncbi:Na(+)/H(+) exchange regulatory cofactor NHE-RF1 [Anopheles maculipalpis]|uniref:Na(+)/H(+) exchange regulatory cofactor NHE-RF1 n=1 Tax=Anopheles maculipalpis TaxID=1496333 RepID=UPI0021599B72|nr:Na(+)/H(+) exchange regulatory cofactor NHE-RF1 [Anopheles maculipalpis]
MTSKTAATNGSTTAKYEPRLCHVVKRPDFDGYGFNLHAEKGRPGQYIGKVDDGSPAESAGLRQGDRIIEVNGQNITTETHKKVVELIKAVPNETRLLVIDPRADANDLKLALAKAAAGLMVSNGTANSNGTSNGHHESNGVNGVAKKDAKDTGVKMEEKSSPKSTTTNGSATVNNNNNINNNNNHSHSNGNGTTTAPLATESPIMEKIIDDTKKVLTVTDGAAVGKMALNGTAPAATEPSKTVPPPTEGKKLNLPMTAAEMRAQLAARKKYDPKSEVCDLRKKYEIIQKM